jgi:hypothetical protein
MTLFIRVWDYDLVSANDIIGIVYIDLNNLLMPDSSGQISSWFPIYDTLKGIRGELNATVKLEFFGNVNEFKDASAGVMFFSSTYLLHKQTHITKRLLRLIAIL